MKTTRVSGSASATYSDSCTLTETGKRPGCPWTRRRVESLQLWIIIQTDFIIKNHHNEYTGIRTAGAYWLPTGERICRPEMCFTVLRAASWCTCMCVCLHVGTICTRECVCDAYNQPINSVEASAATTFPRWHFCIIYKVADILPRYEWIVNEGERERRAKGEINSHQRVND